MNHTVKFNGTLNGKTYDDLDKFVEVLKQTQKDDITDISYSITTTNENLEIKDPETGKTLTTTATKDEPNATCYCESKDDCKTDRPDDDANDCCGCNQELDTEKEGDPALYTEKEDIDDVNLEKARRMQEILENSNIDDYEKNIIVKIICEFYELSERLVNIINTHRNSQTPYHGTRLNDIVQYKLTRIQYMISRLSNDARKTLHDMMYDNVYEMVDGIIDEISDHIDEVMKDYYDVNKRIGEIEKQRSNLCDDFDKERQRIEQKYHEAADELERSYRDQSVKLDRDINELYRISNNDENTNSLFNDITGLFNDMPSLFEI